MANILSPSVNVIEEDQSITIPSLPTTITGMVGDFQWGPCNVIIDVANDLELVDMFGKPNDTNYESFFSAWNFLQYGNNIKIVRAILESTAKNAGTEVVDDTTGTGAIAADALILNEDEADFYTPTFGANAKLQIFAKYPGAMGNRISVAIANTDDFATANVKTGMTFESVFEYTPAADEFAVVVMLDGEIVEQYIVSLTPGSTNFENINDYAPDYINRRSQYILVYDDDTNTDKPDSIEETALLGGVGAAPSNTEVTAGYDLFVNKEEIDVNIIIDGGNTNSTVQQYIIDNLVENRKDCVAYLTVPKDMVIGQPNIASAIADVVDYRKTTLARSSSYAALYGNWKYQYDRYNGKNRWVPLSGDIAGITAFTHYTRDPWFAPSGYNRGIIKNTIKLAINPTRAHRDTLYKNFVNSAVRDSAVGFVVIGQKTLMSAPSSFSRLDVRWLFITIEKAISAAAKFFIDEKNTPFTRRRFKGIIDPYLRDVEGREGIVASVDGTSPAFVVDVGPTVNTEVVIQRGEFRANIKVRPSRSIEFIIIKFINDGTVSSFEEVTE